MARAGGGANREEQGEGWQLGFGEHKGHPLGSYLEAKGLQGCGLDVARLKTTGIEFDSEYILNSSRFSTFLLCSEPFEGHNFLSRT